jgi:hypothetical protein
VLPPEHFQQHLSIVLIAFKGDLLLLQLLLLLLGVQALPPKHHLLLFL